MYRIHPLPPIQFETTSSNQSSKTNKDAQQGGLYIYTHAKTSTHLQFPQCSHSQVLKPFYWPHWVHGLHTLDWVPCRVNFNSKTGEQCRRERKQCCAPWNKAEKTPIFTSLALTHLTQHINKQSFKIKPSIPAWTLPSPLTALGFIYVTPIFSFKALFIEMDDPRFVVLTLSLRGEFSQLVICVFRDLRDSVNPGMIILAFKLHKINNSG